MKEPTRHPWNDDPNDNTGWYDADEMDRYINWLHSAYESITGEAVMHLERLNKEIKGLKPE